MLSLHEVEVDIETAAEMGALPGIDAGDWFAWSTDPRDDYDPSADNVEPCSYLRETANGIQCRRHPEAMLRDAPELWDVVGKWRAGVTRELSREEYSSLSNYEIECWLILSAASGREQVRRMREHDGGGDGV